MTELAKEEFGRVLSLLYAKGANVESIAVAQGYCPGYIFVDNWERPSAALVFTQGNAGFYWIGDMSEKLSAQLVRLVEGCLIDRLRKRGTGWFEISCVDARQDGALQKAFSRKTLTAWQQKVLRFSGKEGSNMPYAPAKSDIQIMELCQALSDETLSDRDFFIKSILDCWESVEAFTRHGAGFCAVDGGHAASVCFTGWVTHDVWEFSVETPEAFRRRGLAGACAGRLLTMCIERGKRPHWECEPANTASLRIARRLGFLDGFDYTCYGFLLEE